LRRKQIKAEWLDPNFHDPRMLQLREAIRDRGAKLSDLSDKSHASNSTICNWMRLKTRRPQACTLAAVGEAMGLRLEFVPMRSAKVIPLPTKRRKIA
jgi:hypothetical protein